jgi:hypothetical protein
MKEPKKIRLNPDAPIAKEPIKYRLPPINKTEWDVTGQDNDDVYISLDMDKNNENNSQDN